MYRWMMLAIALMLDLYAFVVDTVTMRTNDYRACILETIACAGAALVLALVAIARERSRTGRWNVPLLIVVCLSAILAARGTLRGMGHLLRA